MANMNHTPTLSDCYECRMAEIDNTSDDVRLYLVCGDSYIPHHVYLCTQHAQNLTDDGLTLTLVRNEEMANMNHTPTPYKKGSRNLERHSIAILDSHGMLVAEARGGDWVLGTD